ncbi:MAG: fatty acid desaturase family protein [Acidimicrobiia bacterium]|nr:fatty acid desaturase family protein [Acidimicrobiia bacterium]
MAARSTADLAADDGFVLDPRLGGMVPDRSALPTDVLPTDRLLANGKAVADIRAELRKIPDRRNAVTVAWLWFETIGTIVLAAWLAHPLAYLAAFVLMGRALVRFNILGHEAVHRTLFTNKRLNDFVGKWLLSYHAWVPFELYRRGHIDHHRDELGPAEPDTGLYTGYPITRSSLRRKLIRDASGQSGWKILKGLLRGVRNVRTRPVAVRILGAQVVLLAIATAFGRPELWLLLWFLPWMTLWRVINRLRAIAEHGGMTRSKDRRETTHHVRQGPVARFFMVPYKVGWHLAHHVDMGVPCWNLPKLHDELVAAGWITPDYVWPSYRALWKALSSRPETG